MLHKLLYVGFVQAVVNPLNAFVLLCLKDARFKKFETSIVGMIQLFLLMILSILIVFLI